MARSAQFVLPELVVGVADVMRMRRELDALQEFLHQAALRHTSETELKMPKTSRMLDNLTAANQLNLLNREHYEATINHLDFILKESPQIHIAFSTDPSSAFVVKIVEWLRLNIHPLLLVQIGLQPNLAAGCIVRTTNKHFDMSLKHHFEAARPALITKLEEGVLA